MPQKTTLYLILSAVFIFGIANISFASDEFKGIWAGIEVMGGDKKSSELVRKLIPLKTGTPFHYDKDQFKLWCDTVKEKVKAQDIHCAFIGYLEGDYYYNVEITPIGAKLMNFRVLPEFSGDIPQIPKELDKLFEQWDERFMTMIKIGKNPHEAYKDGYVDYQDPLLHNLVKKFVILVSKNNELLLKVIRYSPDPTQRAKASTLLSWSKNIENIEYVLKWDLLNDPDEGVRNDLARALSFMFVDVKNKKTLRDSTAVFCRQATLPSHTDRNKALVSLQNILLQHEDLDLASNINEECRNTLTYISQMSVLPNAGGLAKNILEIIEKSKNG